MFSHPSFYLPLENLLLQMITVSGSGGYAVIVWLICLWYIMQALLCIGNKLVHSSYMHLDTLRISTFCVDIPEVRAAWK